MELVKCHIENFGKLSACDITFHAGYNIFAGPNGWGKSTLAAFIRVMFYGFENERKRKDTENERKRYHPWQGGTYGGSILFRAGGQVYLLERTFGDRPKEDVSSLRDAERNTVISGIDAERAGEYFFQIDSESFRRSVCIGQLDVETGSTASISAKIGDLIDDTDDLSRYDAAAKRIRDKVNSMTPNRATGSLARRQARIRSLQTKQQQMEMLGRSLSEAETEQEKEKITILKVRKTLEELQKKERQFGFLRLREEQREHLRELSRDCQVRKEELDAVRERFGARIPEESEVRKQLSAAGDMAVLEGRVKSAELTEDEQAALRILRKKYRTSASADSETSAEKSRKDTGNSVNIGKIVLTAVVWIAAVLVLLSGWTIAAALLAITGAILILSGMREGSRTGVRGEERERLCRLEEKEREYQKRKTEYGLLYGQISTFLLDIGVTGLSGSLSDQLQQILNLTGRYQHAMKEYEDACRRKEAAEQSMKAEDGELAEQSKDKKRDRASVAADPGEEIPVPEDRGERLTLPLLREEISRNNDLLERAESSFQTRKMQIARMQEQYTELRSEVSALPHEQEQYRRDRDYYQCLVNAGHLLEKAKQSLMSEYTGPVRKSFDYYYGIVTGEDQNQVRLDVDANATVMEQGQQRDVKSMSVGCRDLIWFCLRMAFADAMYQGEKPFLLLDDPFVNLDSERTGRAHLLLQKAAEQYQILYFTCHDSRA